MSKKWKPMDEHFVPSEFDRLLLDIVDETLRQVFISEDVEVIYGYLREKFGLKPEEFAGKPEAFSEGLKDLLGSIQPIEHLILEKLYSKLQLKFTEKRNYTFSDHIKKLRSMHVYSR